MISTRFELAANAARKALSEAKTDEAKTAYDKAFAGHFIAGRHALLAERHRRNAAALRQAAAQPGLLPIYRDRLQAQVERATAAAKIHDTDAESCSAAAVKLENETRAKAKEAEKAEANGEQKANGEQPQESR